MVGRAAGARRTAIGGICASSSSSSSSNPTAMAPAPNCVRARRASASPRAAGAPALAEVSATERSSRYAAHPPEPGSAAGSSHQSAPRSDVRAASLEWVNPGPGRAGGGVVVEAEILKIPNHTHGRRRERSRAAGRPRRRAGAAEGARDHHHLPVFTATEVRHARATGRPVATWPPGAGEPRARVRSGSCHGAGNSRRAMEAATKADEC